MFGRPPPKAPAPDLTVPEPTDTVTKILERFADAGFSPPEAVALLSSHTIAAAVRIHTLDTFVNNHAKLDPGCR